MHAEGETKMKLLKRLLVFFGLLMLLGLFEGLPPYGLLLKRALSLLAMWSLAKEVAG